MLFDNHGRIINYLRLAVTDRCNLRCFYCMPEEGIQYISRQELLSFEEMERVVRLFITLGINKIRITGGEPFVRNGMIDFIEKIAGLETKPAVHITTNGTLTASLVPRLRSAGIKSVNLSLDTLDENRFFQITRRNVYREVMASLDALLEHGIPTRINAVVMAGKNTEDIIPLVNLTRDLPLDVRFIEEMPFNGGGGQTGELLWDYPRILEHIRASFPGIQKIKDPKHSTAFNYSIPGHRGQVGIIAAYSRLFCGTCNRIRLTPQGVLKTCLYDDGIFNIKNLLRAGADDAQIATALLSALSNRASDGFEAERRRDFGFPASESMATIGG